MVRTGIGAWRSCRRRCGLISVAAQPVRRPKPSRRGQPIEAGERGGHVGAIADAHLTAGQLRGDGQAHRDAVVAMAVDRAAVQRAAVDDGAVGRFLARGAQRAQAAAMTAMRSDSLTRSSAAPRTTVRPSASAAATNSAGNSSIMSGTSALGHVDAAQRRVADAQVGDRLAALLARRLFADVGAHQPQGRRAGRCGADSCRPGAAAGPSPAPATPPPGKRPPTKNRPARRRRWRAGDGRPTGAASPGETRSASRRPPACARCSRGSGAARGRGSRPAAYRPASRIADLTWALATGQFIINALKTIVRRGFVSGGRPPSRVSMRAPMRAQRIDDPAHRPARQRGVADQHAVEGLAGQQPGQQAHAGAGIAAIERRPLAAAGRAGRHRGRCARWRWAPRCGRRAG